MEAYQVLVLTLECWESLVPPLPEVFCRQRDCCLYSFLLPPPPQRVGNKKSSHSWQKESKNSRACISPKERKLKLIPKGRQSSDMCFLYHCTRSSVLSSLMGFKSPQTQSECRLDYSPEDVSTIASTHAKLIQPQI